MRSLALASIAAAAVLAAGCGGSSDEAAGDGTATTAPASGTTPEGTGSACASVQFPEPREDGTEKAPTGLLDREATYTLTFATSCGDFTVTLDQDAAPKTSASLVSLARAGYFDDTVFHRIVPGFVIQGGDPTQTGGGGPGYQTVDVPPPDTTYEKGVVAMAKGASEPPGTSGSQFFVVTADAAPLPPEYAVVGTVTDGLDVVEAIGALGDAFEQPTQAIVVEHVAVGESP